MKLTPRFVLLFILNVTALFALISIYNVQGPGDGLISNYLYAQSIVSHQFHANNINLTGTPISGFIIGAIILLVPNIYYALLIYLLILYFGFLAAIYNICKALNIENTIAYAMLLNPFVIVFMFIVNSNQILSAIFLILAISYIIKDSVKSGVLMAFANLSGYITLLFLPALLFMGDKKRVVVSYLLWLVPTALWLVYNNIAFGNPFASYAVALANALPSLGAHLYYDSVVSLLLYPLIYGIFFCVVYFIARGYRTYGRIMNRPGITSFTLPDRTRFVSYLFVALAFISWLVLQPGGSAQYQSEFGSMIVVSILLVFAVLTGEIANRLGERFKIRISIAALALAIIVMLIFTYYYYTGITKITTSYNVERSGSLYANASHELVALNLSSCKIVSKNTHRR